MAGFAAGLITSAAGNVLLTPINDYIAAQYAPPALYGQQQSWARMPIVIPSVESAITLMNTGRIDPAYAAWILRQYGIFWVNDRRNLEENIDFIIRSRSLAERTWSRQADQELRRTLIETYDKWDRVIKLHQTVPDISVAIDLLQRGLIDIDRFKSMIRLAGGNVEAWENIQSSFFTSLGVGDVHAAVNRGIIDVGAAQDAAYRQLGYRQPGAIRALRELREHLPSVGELLLISERQIWSRSQNAATQLFQEFPPQLQEWANKNGLYGSSNIPNVLVGGGENATWAQMLWAANRTPLNMAESMEAYRRHRPNRIARFVGQGIPLQPFTIDRLYDNLIANGYTPRDRDTLAGLAWQPLPFRYVRSIVQLRAQIDHSPEIAAAVPQAILPSIRAADRQWAIDQLIDLGHHPDDAAVHVDFQTATVAIRDAAPITQFIHEQRKHAIEQALEMYEAGVNNYEQTSTALQELGVDLDTIRIATANVDAKKNLEIVKAVTNEVRHDYDNGIMGEQESMASLIAAGVNQDTAQWYINHWRVLRNHTRRVVTAGEVLKWLEQGLIQRPEAIQRLANLGYSNADILTELRAAQVALDHLASRQALAEDRSRHQAHQQLESVAKQAQKQLDAAIAAMRKKLPKSVLLASLKKGIVSPQHVQKILRCQAYPEEEIDLLIRNALYVKPPKAKGGTATETEAEPTSAATDTAGQPPPAEPAQQ